MPAPDIIRRLVERFQEHRHTYRSGRYNERRLQREFLDPFFEALGWDIFNRQRYAELYEVSMLDRLVYESYWLSEAEIRVLDGKQKLMYSGVEVLAFRLRNILWIISPLH
jgi:hypothetical protein